ncbi:hypothetical protein NGC85_14205 [Acinetobacter sp. Z1]|uniref:hypothetical protein n=2 Tax=Acinetobacter TaxID=469 RepID=UPI0020C867BA|nr:hypothetical protein [Acinetobacter sp. Z1]UTO19059.1 hypothetical protein NGC85_14205 [Acinetobacter sp. Z1]
MKKLSKFTWLPIIPGLSKLTKYLKLNSAVLYCLGIMSWFCYLFSTRFEFLPKQVFLLFFLFAYPCWLYIENYLIYPKQVRTDLSYRRFIGFNATLKDIITIQNPLTDYHYKIKLQTNELIPQDQQQEWLITPNLYPIDLRALVGHFLYIESLKNSPLIFNLKPYLLDQNQQEIFFTQSHLEFPKENGQYKKCRYNSIRKVELDNTQAEKVLSIWIKQQSFRIYLNEEQLKLMETTFFPKLLMFSKRQYLMVKDQQKHGVIWHS